MSGPLRVCVRASTACDCMGLQEIPFWLLCVEGIQSEQETGIELPDAWRSESVSASICIGTGIGNSAARLALAPTLVVRRDAGQHTLSAMPSVWCMVGPDRAPTVQAQQSKVEARQTEQMGRLSEEHRRVAAHLDDLQSSLMGTQLHETQRFGQVQLGLGAGLASACMGPMGPPLPVQVREMLPSGTVVVTHGARGRRQPCRPSTACVVMQGHALAAEWLQAMNTQPASSAFDCTTCSAKHHLELHTIVTRGALQDTALPAQQLTAARLPPSQNSTTGPASCDVLAKQVLHAGSGTAGAPAVRPGGTCQQPHCLHRPRAPAVASGAQHQVGPVLSHGPARCLICLHVQLKPALAQFQDARLTRVWRCSTSAVETARTIPSAAVTDRSQVPP